MWRSCRRSVITPETVLLQWRLSVPYLLLKYKPMKEISLKECIVECRPMKVTPNEDILLAARMKLPMKEGYCSSWLPVV